MLLYGMRNKKEYGTLNANPTQGQLQCCQIWGRQKKREENHMSGLQSLWQLITSSPINTIKMNVLVKAFTAGINVYGVFQAGPYVQNVTDRIGKLMERHKFKFIYRPTIKIQERSAKDKRESLLTVGVTGYHAVVEQHWNN